MSDDSDEEFFSADDNSDEEDNTPVRRPEESTATHAGAFLVARLDIDTTNLCVCSTCEGCRGCEATCQKIWWS
jgi:hypothetical protein